MRQLFAIAGCLAAMALPASAQDDQLAAQGHGLLPEPTVAADATLGGIPPPHPFVSDPSGGYSSVLFQSTEDPNFNVTIRDYSFPPDQQAHTLTLPTGALLQTRSDTGEISIAKERVPAATARIAVPAGAPVEVTASGDTAAVVRVYSFETK